MKTNNIFQKHFILILFFILISSISFGAENLFYNEISNSIKPFNKSHYSKKAY